MMVQARIRNALARSERVVGGRTTCMDHVGAAVRRAHGQLHIHIHRCRLVVEAHRSDSAEAKERGDASDPAQRRIHVVDGRIIDPREMFALRSVLASRPGRSRFLRWAEGFPAGQYDDGCLRISGSANGSCSDRGHKAPRALHSYSGDISKASGTHEVCPFGGEAQPFLVVLQSQA
jgi:hypothetical protein